MDLQAQTVTMIAAAVDEPALAADSMSSTIAAIRSDTENVATDIDEVEQGFGRFSEQIVNFKTTAKAFVNGMAGQASQSRRSRESGNLPSAAGLPLARK